MSYCKTVDISSVEKILGYVFKNKHVLRQDDEESEEETACAPDGQQREN